MSLISIISKISDWIPGRREAMQNKIDALKKEVYDLQQKKRLSSVDVIRYNDLLDKLSILERKEQRAR